MNKSSNIVIVTGAASSGKSEWAEYLALQSKKSLIYIATAQKNNDDEEWMRKIEIHRKRRGKNWQLWEIPLYLDLAISKTTKDNCILIDSLGTWVANWLEEEETVWEIQVTNVMISLKNTSSDIILVGEETGWGVVPAYQLGRLFRHRLGQIIRIMGGLANTVYLVVGGYAVDITKIGIKLPVN